MRTYDYNNTRPRMAAEYQDGPAPQPPLTPVENPFIAQNTEGGGGASHEPADTTVTFPTQTPPTYTEAVRRPSEWRLN